jgi:hypothetical protein
MSIDSFEVDGVRVRIEQDEDPMDQTRILAGASMALNTAGKRP